ncbi:MAG: serine/threonine protein kinase, partial [Planctomycetia bacterium]|nr:serine/threonine protein kinase [Planctomycetia bacterium]
MVTALGDLVRVFAEVPLLQPEQQAALPGLQQRCADSKALVVGLLQRGWVTNYQAERLLKGQAASLMLGPYLLLERVGEGGMGQVFKARQVSLGRIVALKVLRPELVADHETLSRFQREVQLAGQLPEHPNLIHAFDAGECGATHYLAMQFVAGIDLERLVQRSGPLAVERACDYIRQAALGLQHAHEHGLVHRDIKPSNLLVSGGDGSPEVVKVLDLGLARLHGDGKQAREKAFLTTDGAVTLGTVDYQSPEQALDFHRADIRADIYSLGCTFFYLLTGKPPFGGGPLALKLMRHQQAEPPDIQELRPEVPSQVAAIVRKMLAKKPADRYQTPGEVAAALAAPRVAATPARLRLPRRWVLAAGAGGAALLLLLVLTTYLLLRPSASPSATRPSAVVQNRPVPPPGSVEATVPEARDYQLVYDLNLGKLSRDIVYDEDRSGQIKRPFDRIAYFMEL